MADAAETHNTAKRDFLIKIQEEAQAKWEAAKIFEVDAPADEGVAPEKFFGNFPYPYMNGLLHLGHAFSLSKLEFASAYNRQQGKHTLFPQAFHLTGMPIKAAADKLKAELDGTRVLQEAQPAADAAAPAEREDPTKFTGKKSKAAAKTGPGSTQWEIMRMSGIPEDEIPQFADPQHWMRYFPPLAVRDMKGMGCGIDWRRSFVTTDINKYYDSFIQWQFWTLHEQGKIVKDKRYSVYSPKDGQPCADHDRASGEGVGPQEYTLVKMKVLELRGKLAELSGKGDVFLMAATLRPETMYGQTNAWIRPVDPKNPESDTGKYGAYRARNGEIFVLTARAARNMCFQDLTPENGVAEKLMDLTGNDLLGLPIKSPRSPYERIYVLPLLTIKMDKGTGVVTSVPSDSPDDYAAFQDLVKKPKLRELYGITDEMVLPFEVIPIIRIPELGDMAAVKLCQDMKIQSQNDSEKLAKAKAEAYRRGFDSGVMLVGEHAGKPVKEAKNLERAELLRTGAAVPYAEPENPVRSRSDDDCVVALTDQWYVIYGEEEWRGATQACLDGMRWYDAGGPGGADSITKGQFEHTLGWLNQWACSRSFGLGTRLPWDPEYLIESLSDSTIYMAYYTVAHLFQRGDMYGESPGPVAPEQLTRGVWDHIFLDGPVPEGCAVPAALLETARREFGYWYPFDLRVSGKDLIQNHLTFCLYTHVAMWGAERWPRSFRCNGHLLLNGAKMSKSTGNFKTLQQALREYGADAMRVGLANAGDTMDDANFEHDTANQAVLRLYRQVEWAEEVCAGLAGLRDGPASTFWDAVFDNEIAVAVHRARAAYESMNFRDVVLAGWYALNNARDAYLVACAEEGLNRGLILKYIETAAQLVAPVTPHTSEYIWGAVLGKQGLVIAAGFPSAPAPDFTLQEAYKYVERMKKPLKDGYEKAVGGGGKKGAPALAPGAEVHANVYVVDRFGGWKAKALEVLARLYDAALPDCFPPKPNDAVLAGVAGEPDIAALPAKQLRPAVFPFVAYKTKQAKEGGPGVLSVRLPFDEADVLEASRGYLLRALQELKGLKSITVHRLAFEDLAAAQDDRVKAALPGEPVLTFDA